MTIPQSSNVVREIHLVRAPPGDNPTPPYDLNILDCLVAKLFVRVAYFFEAPTHPLSTEFWTSSLSKTLSAYRFLTGTVTRYSPTRVVLSENERGCYVEFADDSALTIKGLKDQNFAPTAVPDTLYIPVLQDNDPSWSSVELLRVRITVLADGGIVVALSMFHTFIKDWGAAARGETIVAPNRDPSILRVPVGLNQLISTAPVSTPVFVGPAAPPAPPLIMVENFYFTPSALKALKVYTSSLSLPDGPIKEAASQVSTSDCLAALIWCSILQSLPKSTLAGRTATTMPYLINLRTTRPPLVPMDYVGNAWVSMLDKSCKFQIEDLIRNEDSIRMAACDIRTGILALTPEYFETFPFKGPTPGDDNVKVLLTSWKGFGVYDTDFGLGRPIRFMPQSPNRLPVIIIFIRPMCDEQGGEAGAEFQLVLGAEAMERLKKNSVFSRFAHWYNEDGSLEGCGM
ncbi:hypothetical protein SmJEL517_g06270 [Synchytrium microbalum]|uniref:Transferase n=1 Tax=Synchytrium microbalum TaxID=1806994 RepID=A0A507BQC0_9FUNG|nr:uncharacterized protein SmJEL517_g06270 [Synchytrium microbalum]TPX30072.1 hypothetical protein SmJEL517_g06270 [Synchytrium microbalum]